MRLTAFSRHADPAATPLSAVFQAPGGTLGRSAENHLALPDSERGICRVQAALRISDDACYLVNLSSMGSVSINGRVLTRDQEVPLQPGDELSIGPYTLKAEDPAAPVATAVAGAA
ncbi:FHA domain-containing protein, partial [Bordetella petrii]|uniref:FHA domain-containing protein n=1 Tax=Bordetella petrii TaxID=94624 RepID=UPI001E462AAF